MTAKSVSVFFLAASSLLLTASAPPKPANICQAGETVVFSFVTKAGKTAALCQGPKEAYLVYRFGTAAKIELQYPAKLDASSWQKFTYWSYHRGGGAHNAGLEIAKLKFTNQGVKYELSDQTSAFYNKQKEEDYRREVGIDVVVKGKTIFVAGDAETAVGDMMGLKDGHKVKFDEDMMN
jgi:hypothetical protein